MLFGGSTYVDLSRIGEYLDYHNYVSIEQGYKQTVSWIIKNRKQIGFTVLSEMPHLSSRHFNLPYYKRVSYQRLSIREEST